MAVATRGLDIGALEEHCLAELERWRVPGIEVIAIRDGEVLFAGGFGRRRLDPDLPVTADTIFAHGSTGKAFTAFLVCALAEAGLLSLDVPVREYLPALRLADATVAERVTLRDLLSHRSGLARHDLAWIAHPSETSGELLARLRHLPLSADLRQAWQYSNWGFMLAGQVVEAVTGSTYGDELSRRVFEPLGFKRTYTSTAAVRALDDHAEPYRVRDGRAAATPWRAIDNAAPAGGIYSCALDTAKWLQAQLKGGETHALQMPIPSQPGEDIELNGYGLGWCVGTYRGRRLVWHNGGVDGFYTEFLLLPNDGIAVGTCNNAGEPISAAVARHVADVLLDAQPRDWGAELHKAAAAEGEGAGEAGRKVVPGTAPSHPLADYAGTYRHPGYGELTFELSGGALAARLGELELVSSWRHYDTWDLTLATLGEVSVPATFYTGQGGDVTDVFLPLEASVEPVRFSRQAAAPTSPEPAPNGSKPA